jgi:hypothetical protein
MPIDPSLAKKTNEQMPEHAEGAKGYAPDIGDTSKMSKEEKGAKTKEQGEKDLATHEQDPLAHPAYKTFKTRVAAVLVKIGSSEDPEALAADLWKKAYGALAATDAAYDKVDKDKASGRTDMGAKAYQDLLPAFDGLTAKLTELLAVQGQKAKTWAFWSTSCARAAGEANCEMSLETSAIGWVFDNMNLTGDWDMQLWGALSKAYALAAVSKIEGRSYHGFVGPGVGNMTIYNKVEEPAVKTATANVKVKPKFRFHAVAPAEGKNPWDMAFDANNKGGDFAGTYGSFDDRTLAVKTADIRWKQQQADEIAAGKREDPNAKKKTA